MSIADYGATVGSKAPEFSIVDHSGKEVTLKSLLTQNALMIVFYPGDFTLVCTKQLCNYQDNMEEFQKLGISVVGISSNPSASHVAFSKKYGFTFPLLSDPKKELAKKYGCSSLLMLGGISRAVFIVNKLRVIVYRYVEPTVITRRPAGELLKIIQELKKRNSI